MFDKMAAVIFVCVLRAILFCEDPDQEVLTVLAKYMMKNFNRDHLPDWVAALSNANVNNWAAALDEIRTGSREEEKDDNEILYGNGTE